MSKLTKLHHVGVAGKASREQPKVARVVKSKAQKPGRLALMLMIQHEATVPLWMFMAAIHMSTNILSSLTYLI